MQSVLLRNMSASQKGTIKSINVGGELGRRLREMGLIPGTEITVSGRAPLHDPVVIKVRSSNLSLRNSEADHIQVEIN